MVLKSTVSKAKTGTNSVRTTIPEGLAEYLGLNEGDKVVWFMRRTYGGANIAIVVKENTWEQYAMDFQN